jgi:F-type H+-transporting ATPase subunit delta
MNKISRRALARYSADQLQKGISASKLASQLASVMIESKLSKQTDFLVNDIISELEQRGRLTAASITSARPLSENLETELKTALKKLVQVETVLLNNEVDKSVLGGVRIETPTRVWDSTVARQLRDLREAF